MTGIIAKRDNVFHEMKLPRSTRESPTAALGGDWLARLLTADPNRLLVCAFGAAQFWMFNLRLI